MKTIVKKWKVKAKRPVKDDGMGTYLVVETNINGLFTLDIYIDNHYHNTHSPQMSWEEYKSNYEWAIEGDDVFISHTETEVGPNNFLKTRIYSEDGSYTEYEQAPVNVVRQGNCECSENLISTILK